MTSGAGDVAVIVADEGIEAGASRVAGLRRGLEMQESGSHWAQTESPVAGPQQLDSRGKVKTHTTHPFYPRPLPPSEKRVK